MSDFIPNNVTYRIIERRNVHVKGNKEWAFTVQFRMNENAWTIFTWTYKPSEKEIENILEITLRAIDVFYRNLQLPTLNIKPNRIQ